MNQRLTDEQAEQHVQSIEQSIRHVGQMVMNRSVMGGLQEEQKQLDIMR